MSNPEKAENFHCGTSICHIEKKKGFEQLEKNRKKNTHNVKNNLSLSLLFLKQFLLANG